MRSVVDSSDRFNENSPCPVCGGHDHLPAGQGVRCWGYVSDGGTVAHCTREEYAGAVHRMDSSSTYPHGLGDCSCGIAHAVPQIGPTTLKGKAVAAVYSYRDERGLLLYQCVRLEPKAFLQRRPDGRGGWAYNMRGVRRVPYQLDRVLAATTGLFVVEGEKDADALAALNVPATTNVGGAGKWLAEFKNYFAGKLVAILPDNDPAGRDHAHDVAQSLHGVAAAVRIVDLPVPAKGDVSDWLAAGGTSPDLYALANQAPIWAPGAVVAPAQPAPQQVASSGGGSISSRLVELAEASGLDLFHDAECIPYACITLGGHRETWGVQSKRFDLHLRNLYFLAEGMAPSARAVADAIATLTARAVFSGDQRAVHTRLASHDGRIYLDLAADDWRVVEVSEQGFRIIDSSTLHFRRVRGMFALPEPVHGGSLALLRPFVNVSDEEWPLLLAWLIAAIKPTGPYPVLGIHGEQGSAKSMAARLLRLLLDPNRAPLRAEPRDARDLMITAGNAWIVVLDNLSYIEAWLSDALCRLATGGGYATRELYSNDGEMLFDAQRPVIMTGIEEVATRPDLLDRMLVLSLPTIPEDERRTEADMLREFETVRPAILGALLEAAAVGLRELPNAKPARLPRLADFALWVIASESGLGLAPGAFTTAYEANRAAAIDLSLDASLVVPPLRLLAATTGFTGSFEALLAALNLRVKEETRKQRGWPRSASILSNIIKRLEPGLRAIGIEVTRSRTAQQRTVTVTATASQPGALASPVVPSPLPALGLAAAAAIPMVAPVGSTVAVPSPAGVIPFPWVNQPPGVPR
jgi:hypothetical protein